MRPIVWTLTLVVLLSVWLVRPCQAQETKAAGETRSILDGVYSEAQAERGQALFDQRCGACHGPGEFGATSFLQSWAGARVYDLYRVISTTMPFDNPGGLDPQEYADVLAYIFGLNGIPAGESELEGDDAVLKQIRIERPSADDAEQGPSHPHDMPRERPTTG